MRLAAHAFAATLAVGLVAFPDLTDRRRSQRCTARRRARTSAHLQRRHGVAARSTHRGLGVGHPGQTVSASIVARNVRGDPRQRRSGAWSLRLAPLPAGGPLRLVVRQQGDSLVVANVLIGDVWVASGQSNMEFSRERGRERARRPSPRRTIRPFANSRFLIPGRCARLRSRGWTLGARGQGARRVVQRRRLLLCNASPPERRAFRSAS